MKVHNLMEDIVQKKVNEICEVKKDSSEDGPCTTDLCKLDIACFVLNRIKPKYVTSGRGVAHVDFTLEDPQLDADISALVHEGFGRINQVKRNYYHDKSDKKPEDETGPYFNFPIIKGRIFSGKTFEPVQDLTVFLLEDGKVSAMNDPRWQNPFIITRNTPGTYTFWPEVRKAPSLSASKTFHFHIRTEETDFEPLNHFFEISLTAEENLVDDVRFHRSYKNEDLYLFLK